ncbi:membrane protein [Elstera cyanobacteriorum]|uniref:DUF924 domain-containing protein n=1 Tax=Elstera cyanobacteriorum TaxID=2022747 RepID=A0A255XNC4_9PROT|nr:DUF924 family protein [Elstera cyanobacteriorum]OYQ17760.1 hypothetical protein CHR90_12305 [Elstera cyanobacteriorum]GFZ86357.1 membrane protein [Elstera cyanobacteriorum]
MTSSAAILDFWFGPAEPQAFRAEWFEKNPEFDQEIARRFQIEIGQALTGGLAAWEDAPRSALALILLLDQFPRNAYRNTPRAFSGDPRGQQVALLGLERGYDRKLTPLERFFFYLPFEHAEDLGLQEKCVELMLGLETESSQIAAAKAADYAEKHRAIIARFGRFPHRNDILGRESTLEEIEFLQEPGSSF